MSKCPTLGSHLSRGRYRKQVFPKKACGMRLFRPKVKLLRRVVAFAPVNRRQMSKDLSTFIAISFSYPPSSPNGVKDLARNTPNDCFGLSDAFTVSLWGESCYKRLPSSIGGHGFYLFCCYAFVVQRSPTLKSNRLSYLTRPSRSRE